MASLVGFACSSPKFVRVFSTIAPRALTIETINPKVLQAEYAVRGEIVLRALEHKKTLESPQKAKSLPFSEIISCNIGNPQELKQPPISFFRQVLALCVCPSILDSPRVGEIFPEDAITRARHYLSCIPGGTGAYSNSQGVEVVREEVAKFISARDQHECKTEQIFLTDGASPAVQTMLKLLIRDESDSIMIPIPQYPLYSASIALLGGSQTPYYLDEEKGWGMNLNELELSLSKAKKIGKNVRAIAVINPGNPTGQCLFEEDIRQVIDFSAKNHLVILADEVYQENVWATGKKFFSFKKVLCDMGSAYSHVPLVSFHSVSKGFLGECGRRGGYMELVNFNQDIIAQIYKLVSVNLCSNLDGQIMMGLMVNPPQPGSISYDQYIAEKGSILDSLRRRAAMIADTLNKLEGVKCNEVEGALYAFPQIHLPPKAIEAAKAIGKSPDLLYCRELLDNTGMVIVPGSGFGQKEGTYHFRTTILPPEDKFASVLERFAVFHNNFLNKYT